MPAYAVIARIGRVEPHLAVHGLDRDVAPAAPDDASPIDATVADLWTTDGRFAAWLVRLRELWTQTTFYLFDAESWRR